MVTKDAELMNIDVDEQFMKNYQAIYYAMNAKPDCRSKLFQRDVMVTFQDLKNLNDRVTEKFKAHYDNAGFKINVNINFKNKECLEFESWTTFEHFSLTNEQAITSILIVWEYNAKLPNFRLPQRHTLTVRIADELRAEEMLNLVISGKLEEIDKIEQEFCPIIARVDFINAMMGDELLRIVEQWQELLSAPAYMQNTIYKKAKKFRRVIAYALNYLTTFIFMYFSVQYLYGQALKLKAKYIGELLITDVAELLVKFAMAAILCMIVYKISQLIANHVFNMLKPNTDTHIFKITNGDNVLCQKLDQNSKTKKTKVIIELAFTFLFNVACSIFANLIS